MLRSLLRAEFQTIQYTHSHYLLSIKNVVFSALKFVVHYYYTLVCDYSLYVLTMMRCSAWHSMVQFLSETLHVGSLFPPMYCSQMISPASRSSHYTKHSLWTRNKIQCMETIRAK